MNLHERSYILSAIKGVDYVIPYEVENDITVCRALEAIKPYAFTKGGDRKDKQTIPEWEVCEKHGIKLFLNVDNTEYYSSSSFYLNKWKGS